jgi:ABC-type dipeptide/oligopeptide/nickel transport system permease component
MIAQYGIYMANVFQGKFGDSFVYQRPVIEVIASRIPASLELMMAGVFLSIIVGILLGVYSAVGRGKFIDIAGRGIAFMGMSTPQFVLGMMLILIFAVKAGVLPVGGRYSIGSVILPAITLAVALTAGLVRLTRSAMLEVLDADYLTFARSKGLSEQIIIWKHAFKNASIPIITFVMFMMIILISGDVVVENVFAWPGLGRLTLQAVIARDYTLVQAVTLLIVFGFIIISLIADIAYAYLNPKVRYQRKA